jgi:poly(A) polymerase
MRDQAIEIIKVLRDNGHEAVIAGGAVRDFIMGNTPSDFDIATSAFPDQVEALFDKTLAIGKSFGVIVVVLGGYEIEVATFREDSKESQDGRHPDSVTFSSMEKDALRRDLTINGLFLDPLTNKIYDFVGGQKDIHDKVIRLIGDPDERIKEDFLRMMRVIRFAARFSFDIEPETLEAVKRHAPEIVNVSMERISDEFMKILRTGNYRFALNLFLETKLIDYFIPEFRAMVGCEQPPDYHPEIFVIEHVILALESLDKTASDELRMAVLLHDIGKPPTRVVTDRIRFNGHDAAGKRISAEILARMKFSNDFIDKVSGMVGNHMKFLQFKNMKTSTLKRFISIPYFEEHLALHRADCAASGKGLDHYNFVLKKIKSIPEGEINPSKILNGKDLLELGLERGPMFGVILNDVRDRQLEGELKTRQESLDYVKIKYCHGISENTLKNMDANMKNFAKGIVSEPIDTDELNRLT